MGTNRVNEWLDAAALAGVEAIEETAFVTVPLAAFPAAQHDYIAAVYRTAAERACRDLESRAARTPRFSLN